VIDVATDPTTSFTPVVVRSAATTPVATPEVASIQTQQPGRDTVAESFEPMLNGARLGLVGSVLGGFALLGLRLVRRTGA
jgi:hypothetical protein